jgi:HK97 family phage major capsid protein
MLGDQRAAVLKTLIAQRSTLDEQIAEAEAVAEAEHRAAAGKDQAERSEALAAATRLPGGSPDGTEVRTAPRVEIRSNMPLPKGAGFADLADEKRTTADFGRAVRGLIRHDPDYVNEFRAQSENTDSAGGVLVPTDLSSMVLDLARSATVTAQAGARIVPMSHRDVVVPKVVSDPTPAWRAESEALADSGITFGSVNLSAKSLAVLVKAPWELVDDAEQFGEVLATSLAAKFAVALDYAALFGAGTDTEPNGLANQITNTATYDTIDSFDPIVHAVQTVRQANYIPGAAIMGEDVFGEFGNLKGGDNQPLQRPSYLDNVLDLPTSAVTDGSIIVGDFSNLFIGMRQQFTLRVLQERFADVGQIGVIAVLRADVANARSDAFTLVTPAAD